MLFDATSQMIAELRSIATDLERSTSSLGEIGIPARATVQWAAADALDAMARACRATLLFHDGTPWTDAKAARWRGLTGSAEATTRVLCNTIRAALPETAPAKEGT